MRPIRGVKPRRVRPKRPSVRGWGSGDDRGFGVSADGSQRVVIARSDIEAAMRKLVSNRFDERLLAGFSTAQAVEADLTGLEIDLGANQPMLPKRVYFPSMSQQFDCPFFAGAAQID